MCDKLITDARSVFLKLVVFLATDAYLSAAKECVDLRGLTRALSSGVRGTVLYVWISCENICCRLNLRSF